MSTPPMPPSNKEFLRSLTGEQAKTMLDRMVEDLEDHPSRTMDLAKIISDRQAQVLAAQNLLKDAAKSIEDLLVENRRLKEEKKKAQQIQREAGKR